MDVKEKLVELLGRVQQMGVIYREDQCDVRYSTIEQIRNTEVAARLIAYGVTVQEWISVEDRLPEKDGSYLVTINSFGGRKYIAVRWFAKDGEAVDEYELAGQENVWYYYDSEWGCISVDSITNWMPIPNPPKENERC